MKSCYVGGTAFANLVLAIAISLLPVHAVANRELPLSLDAMATRSHLIVDGEVKMVVQTRTEEIPLPDSHSSIKTHFNAEFQIHKVLKSDSNVGQIPPQITISYWRTVDPRYSGDVPPELKVGDKFRLFSQSIEKTETGEVKVIVYTANEVRPEAFDVGPVPLSGTIVGASGPSLPSASMPRDRPNTPNAAPASSVSDSSPTSMRSWFLSLGGALLILLLIILLRPRK